MADKKELMDGGKGELLNIFTEEEDKKGTDLLSMSDLFEVFIGKIEVEMGTDTAWEVFHNIEGFIGEIAAAIKGGFDISKMGMLVADYSHFSQDIIDGLKEGIYHVGQSKEVAGNLRPAILDENEHLVKFFTLKKSVNPSSILADISTLSMQASLQRISSHIEDIGRDVKGMIDFARREALSNKFIYARDRIMLAATASEKERELYLKEADTYLMEGLTDLYSDVNAQVKALTEIKGLFASVKAIDSVLSYINEDMQMIPRYVGLRVYLFNYRGKTEDANRILSEYRYQLQTLADRKLGNGKYTALELIHKNYPYDNENVDFWLEKPKQMLGVIDSCETMLAQKDKDIFYIDVEGSEDEQ
ncbi:MAG: hypothetical protein MSJ26_01540 [Oscillospiraceae bacterium]|nr:hypothetical protein [Oscillospiraceae bacterium]